LYKNSDFVGLLKDD